MSPSLANENEKILIKCLTSWRNRSIKPPPQETPGVGIIKTESDVDETVQAGGNFDPIMTERGLHYSFPNWLAPTPLYGSIRFMPAKWSRQLST